MGLNNWVSAVSQNISQYIGRKFKGYSRIDRRRRYVVNQRLKRKKMKRGKRGESN